MELVVLAHAGRRFAIKRNDAGRHFLDVDHRIVGPVISDCSYFHLDGLLVLAGVEGEGAHHVTIEGMGVARVIDGAWLAFPAPLTPGVRVALTWRDEQGDVLRRYTTPPLDLREIEAGWTGYAEQ